MDRGIAGVVCVMVFGAGLGCASSTQPAVSAAVRELHEVDCPDDRVHVLETRDAGGDTIYVVDACGQKLEVTKGYGIPERKSQLSEYSAESGFEYPQGMQPTVPADVTAVVRTKVQRWCRTAAPDNPEAIAFYADSPDKCRADLANALSPIGTESGKHGEPDIYWFTLGKYVFTAQQAFSSAGAPEKQVSARKAPSSVPEDRIFYARVELGFGYLNTTRASSAGASIHIRPQFGFKVMRNWAFGLATANHYGLSDDIPNLYEAGLTSSYYPVLSAGLRLEGTVSATWLRFVDESEYSEVGGLFSAAIGYDDFALGTKDTNRWSGFGVTLRGFYATVPNVDTVSGALYVGWFWW